MHKSFGDWHRNVGIEANADTSPKHWNVINAYQPTADEIVAFARLFYGFSGQEEKGLDKFGTALQEVDPTFSMKKDKQQLLLFAGSELISMIERYPERPSLADFAALCLVCGGAQGLRTNVPIPDVPTIAARFIENRTSHRALSVDTEDNADLPRVEREVVIVGEEVNMLWWLVSEFSRDRRQPWKDIGLLATSVISGKELADLTRIIPGPVAAAAFLDRIVRLSDSAKKPKAISVKAAVDETPLEWRQQYDGFKSEDDLRDLAPISNAIKLSLTVSEKGDWSPVFEKGTALEASSRLLPNALAYQIFLERLMVRLNGELD
jgi:hypothetical protein